MRARTRVSTHSGPTAPSANGLDAVGAHLGRRPTPPLRRQALVAPVERFVGQGGDGSLRRWSRASTIQASFKLARRELRRCPRGRRRRRPDLPEQFRIRQAKRERLLAEGRDPYPVEVARTHTLAELRAEYADLEVDTKSGQIVGIAGRVVFARNSGKLCFATLQEGDGTQLQAMVSLDGVGQDSLGRVEVRRRPRRHRVPARRGDQFAPRRIVCACRFLANHLQGAAAPSRRAQGAQRGVAECGSATWI